MSAFTKLLAGFRGLFRRRAVDRELDDEVRHYVDQATAANIARGMTPDDAARAARASIGSVGAAQAPARGWGWDVAVEAFAQDVRYAVRYLLKSPGFTIAASLSLALGIGANSAIFSMVNATLIRSLPVERPDELVAVTNRSFSYPIFDDFRRAGDSFTGLAAFGGISVSVLHGDATDLVSGAIVTGNYFDVLGVRPLHGRLLSANDDVTPGAHPVAVISSALWQTRFGGRTDIAGTAVRINGQPFTIVGVTPPEFQGVQQGVRRDLYVPMMMQAWMRPPRGGYSGEMNPDLLQARGSSWLIAVGRLRPSVSIEQAAAAMTATARALGDWTSDDPADPPPTVELGRLADGPPGQRAQLVSVAQLLSAVVLVVLVIACANVANLLLSRATARRKEIAVRLAIGATRARLVRQLLTESVLLAAVGGALGLGLAWASIRAVQASPPPPGALPVTLDFAIDVRVLAFTFGLSVITGIVFGLVPALRASRPDLVPALKDQASAAARARRVNARSVLVVAQVGLSLVLLVSAGLFIRSLQRTQAIDPGFDVDRIVTVPLNIQLLRYTREQGVAFYREVVDRVEDVPGVAAASMARWLPLSGARSSSSLIIEGIAGPEESFRDEGGGPAPATLETVMNAVVGVRYFETMGIALTRGRDFSVTDAEGAPHVAVVNERFASAHFQDENPIGRRFSLRGPAGPWIEIVGVAADSRYLTLDEDPQRLVYLPIAQHHTNGMNLLVRATGDPVSIATAVGRAVNGLDPSLPLAGTMTMTELVGTSIYAARAGALLLTGFGALALLLAAVGLYGVLSYAVSRRTREFGLRMALGADRRMVLAQVLREGVTLVVVGVAAGLVVAFTVTRLLAGFLYGVSTTDAATFAGTPVLLLAVATVASLLPARRATQVEPVRALKEE